MVSHIRTGNAEKTKAKLELEEAKMHVLISLGYQMLNSTVLGKFQNKVLL